MFKAGYVGFVTKLTIAEKFLLIPSFSPTHHSVFHIFQNQGQALLYSHLCSKVVTFELDDAEDNVDGPQKQIQSQEMLPLHLNAPFISIPALHHFSLWISRISS